MKTVLKISTVLSWFNLILWGLVTCSGLLFVLMSQNMAFLVAVFLISAIVLHSYAALQLRKSIRNPDKPLNSQTPVGIRFIGVIALFLGITFFANSVAIIQNPREFLQLLQASLPQAKQFSASYARADGIFGLVCGLFIAVNVILNFRLLRWYHFMKGMM